MAKIDRVQEVSTELLKPYGNNAKIHGKDQVEKIAESIKAFGFLNPCLIDKDFNVIAGHGRLLAAQSLGMKEIPCIYIEGLTEAERKAYTLADNRLGELAEWNMDLVYSELADLDDVGFDVDLTGFDFDLDDDVGEVIEDDYDVNAEDIEPKCNLGDLWQLGDHRLMCGDCIKAENVEKLMNGKKADLVLTDPPYGISVVSSNNKIGGNNIVESNVYSTVIGDESTETAKNNYEIIKDNSDNQIIFGGNYFTDFLFPSRCWIVWDKQRTGNFADAELAWTSFDKGVKLYHYLWNGLCREGSRDIEGISRVHPTQKPVGLFAQILNDFSKEGDTVLDCFGGSGSTLIACEQTNRICFMMELDPHYCDVIIDRWEQFTGKKAVLLESGS